ncbi:MAG TPA: hypothetical protein VGK33_19615 [Chloroflexota bacterium]
MRAELAEDMSLDPDLGCHLLIRGWAGGFSKGERVYVHAHAEWARKAAARGRERAATDPNFLANRSRGFSHQPQTTSEGVRPEDGQSDLDREQAV